MITVAQRLALAAQHHAAGRYNEAEALYRGILQESPQHPHALHLLGVLAHQAGRHQEAIDLIQRALAAHGPHPIFHSNLAAVHLATGQLTEAVAHGQAAIRLKPDHADAYNNVGVALRRLGQLSEAAIAFRTALRGNPRHVDARTNLGATLQQLGQLPEALSQLQEALRQAPNNAQAHNDLAGVLILLDEVEPALDHLREAIRLRPDFIEARNNLGTALRHLDRIDEAVQCFQEALRIAPWNVAAHNKLGHTLEIQGKQTDALAEYLQALRLDPMNSRTISSLSSLAAAGHYHVNEEQLRDIQELASRQDLPADDRYRLHYSLGRLLDKSGPAAEAFEYFRQANEIRKEFERTQMCRYDPDAHSQQVDRLLATFTPAYFERVRSFGLDSELPIFIVGMMRSGTTLVEQILASHSQVHGAGELRSIGKLIDTMSRRLGGTDGYPECTTRLEAALARELAAGHLRSLQHLAPQALHVVDKMPVNFLHLAVIATLFPRGQIIHCRRDPVDTCLSCYFQNFANPLPFTLDLRHLGHYYREYERVMDHWEQVLPTRIFQLRYEELTANQEALSRQLIAFCGLGWQDGCLRFNDNPRVVHTASTLQVRKPMYRGSVGRWKRYEAQLQPLLEVLRQDKSASASGSTQPSCG